MSLCSDEFNELLNRFIGTEAGRDVFAVDEEGVGIDG